MWHFHIADQICVIAPGSGVRQVWTSTIIGLFIAENIVTLRRFAYVVQGMTSLSVFQCEMCDLDVGEDILHTVIQCPKQKWHVSRS